MMDAMDAKLVVKRLKDKEQGAVLRERDPV